MMELLNDHKLHLQLLVLVFAAISMTIGLIRYTNKHHEKRTDEVVRRLESMNQETRDAIGEIKTDVRDVGKDTSEIRKSLNHFITRDEHQKDMDRIDASVSKGFERVHGRIDYLEREFLITVGITRHTSSPKDEKSASKDSKLSLP